MKHNPNYYDSDWVAFLAKDSIKEKISKKPSVTPIYTDDYLSWCLFSFLRKVNWLTMKQLSEKSWLCLETIVSWEKTWFKDKSRAKVLEVYWLKQHLYFDILNYISEKLK